MKTGLWRNDSLAFAGMDLVPARTPSALGWREREERADESRTLEEVASRKGPLSAVVAGGPMWVSLTDWLTHSEVPNGHV